MRIIGILSWYDESPTWISAAVAGFARVCDGIVAVDGAYSLYPGARPRSKPEEAETILQICEAMDVDCVVHRPRDIWWGNEVEKRNQTLKLAATLDPDWLMVFDADHHVMRCDADTVREKLTVTELNAATYTVLDGKDILADPGLEQYARVRELDTEWTTRARHIYRWTPDLVYGPAHYTLRGTYNGVREWVWGPDQLPEGQPFATDACDLLASLVVVHRNQHRALVRQQAAAGYYQTRDTVGVERFDHQHFAEEARC